MNKMKHTQGEWVIKTPNNSYQIVESEYGQICTMAQQFGTDESEANAKLIAAAPDLLNRLIDLLEWANIKDGSPSQGLRDECTNAIIKALGNETR